MTDLQRRIRITLAALALYSLGTHIPMPGVDAGLYLALFADGNHLLPHAFPWGSGRVLQTISIFTLGVVPYLTAALLVRLTSLAFSRLRAMETGSPSERQRIILGTRVLALLLAGFQAHALVLGLEYISSFSGPIVPEPGGVFRAIAVLTVICGLVVIIWLADQITQHGVGNGVALILFADIVADLPRSLAAYVELTRTGAIPLGLLGGLIALAIALIALIAMMERAVPFAVVRFPQQQVGDRTLAATTATIPLRINNGGLVSAVIAMWLLSLAFYVLTLIAHGDSGGRIDGWYAWAWHGHPARLTVTAILIVAMTYLYSLAVVEPKKAAGFLQGKGAGLLRASPGQETERALRGKLLRLSVIGGSFLALVYLFPEMLYAFLPQLPGAIGGPGFLLAVAVALDTMRDVALRLHWGSRRPPPGEAMAIAMELPDQPRINAADR